MAMLLLALAGAAFVADPAGVTRGLVIAGWAVLIHAVLSVVAAVVAGWVDRQEDPKQRGAEALWCILIAGLVADVAAGVGAAVLPGSWYAAGLVALVGGAVAVLGTWSLMPLVRPGAMRATGPEAMIVMFSAMFLPPALILGLVVRGVWGLFT